MNIFKIIAYEVCYVPSSAPCGNSNNSIVPPLLLSKIFSILYDKYLRPCMILVYSAYNTLASALRTTKEMMVK